MFFNPKIILTFASILIYKQFGMNLMIESFQSEIYRRGVDMWQRIGVDIDVAHILNSIVLVLALFLALFILDLILRKIITLITSRLVYKSKTKIDDYLVKNGTLKNIAHLIPLWIAYQTIPVIFTGFSQWTSAVLKFIGVLIIITVIAFFRSLAGTLKDTVRDNKRFSEKPLDSYLQVVSIILYIICGILIITHLFGISPMTILGGFGAASAIVLLVFKDTILGFVASIQVSANDSVRVGDWIEMPKYGVDGDVLQINLNNVRVQNWDKTIVTIPTYTLLSDAFKNYRGMQDTGGRRIKRSINIKISTIRYLTEKEIEELRKIELLTPYIDGREREIQKYNKIKHIDESMPVNGRRMTNVGLFRAYIEKYARENPDIHQGLTLMVRQLAPNEHGLPLELYMFTKGTQWVFFENTMADVFDHLLAAIKYFHLEVFELPASDDIRMFLKDQ